MPHATTYIKYRYTAYLSISKFQLSQYDVKILRPIFMVKITKVNSCVFNNSVDKNGFSVRIKNPILYPGK